MKINLYKGVRLGYYGRSLLEKEIKQMEYLPMAMWLGVYGTAIASVPAMARLKFMKGAF